MLACLGCRLEQGFARAGLLKLPAAGATPLAEAARQRRAAMDAFRRQLGPAAAAYSGCEQADISALAAAAVAEVANKAGVDARDRRAADAAVVHCAAQGRLPSPLLVGSPREALAAAVPAAKALLGGLEAGRVHAVKQAVQRQHRLADMSCVFRVGAEGAAHLELPLAYELSPLESTFAVDHAKSWQQKKKRRKAAEEAAAAAEDGGLALAFAPAPSSGHGRSGKASTGAGMASGGRGRGKQRALQREMSAAASVAQASAAAAVAAAAASEATAAASVKGLSRKRRAAAATQAAAAQSQGSSDVQILEDDSVCQYDGGSGQQQRPQQGAQPPAATTQQDGTIGEQRPKRQGQAAPQPRRRRKGDLDEEQALAAALQASLADVGDATEAAYGSTPAAAATGGTGGSQAKAVAKRTPTQGSKALKAAAGDAASPKPAAADTGAGSAVAAHRCLTGLFWVEVFCRELDEDGAETGVCRQAGQPHGWPPLLPRPTGHADEASVCLALHSCTACCRQAAHSCLTGQPPLAAIAAQQGRHPPQRHRPQVAPRRPGHRQGGPRAPGGGRFAQGVPAAGLRGGAGGGRRQGRHAAVRRPPRLGFRACGLCGAGWVRAASAQPAVLREDRPGCILEWYVAAAPPLQPCSGCATGRARSRTCMPLSVSA